MRSPRTHVFALRLIAPLFALTVLAVLPTPFGQSVSATPIVLRSPDGVTFLVYSGSLHPVDPTTLAALGLQAAPSRTLSERALDILPEGADVPALANGSFIADAAGARYLAFDGLHAIPDDATFAANGWAGVAGFAPVTVATVDEALLAIVPRGAPLAPAALAGDQRRFDWGYCTWWVAQRRAVPWNGDAVEWYANAQALGYAVGQTPVPGAILVRRSASWTGYGHVAYVESVRGTEFTVSEMNVNALGELTTATYDIAVRPPPGLLGFVYWRYAPPDAPPAKAADPPAPGPRN